MGSLAVGAGCMAAASPMALLSACSAQPNKNLSYLDKVIYTKNLSPVYYWTDILLQHIRNLTFTPPPATRALAMGQTAGFLGRKWYSGWL